MSAAPVRLVERRAVLLLEEFLLSLGATYVSSFKEDSVGFDYLAFFTSEDGSTRMVAIEMKATERQIGGRFPIHSQAIKKAAGMNVPALIVVVDVKRDEVFYAWAKDALEAIRGANVSSIPLQKATSNTNDRLVAEIFGSAQAVSA